nr:FG-GAP-like repeat-containing protein [Streptomyces agglomeratus]
MRTQVIHQDSPGVPGAGEEDDMFGESLAGADLNKDGYADLVAGNPFEHVGDEEYPGSVTVLWGSASGLAGGTAITPKSGAKGHFGRDLVTGDFTGDGSPDVAVVGGSGTWLYRGGFTKSGTTGSVSEIDKAGISWSSSGLAAGRVDGDGKADLVVLGVQASGTDYNVRAWFLKGTSTGLSSGASKTLAAGQDEDGLNAAVADFDKDGYGDIAVGEPDESNGKGAVNIWYGASSGPSSTRSAKLTQATTGVSGTPEAYDDFAYDVSAADSNGDGYADLVVGVPHEDVDGQEDQGGVHLFRGGSGGLSGSRSSWIPQSVTGQLRRVRGPSARACACATSTPTARRTSPLPRPPAVASCPARPPDRQPPARTNCPNRAAPSSTDLSPALRPPVQRQWPWASKTRPSGPSPEGLRTAPRGPRSAGAASAAGVSGSGGFSSAWWARHRRGRRRFR